VCHAQDHTARVWSMRARTVTARALRSPGSSGYAFSAAPPSAAPALPRCHQLAFFVGDSALTALCWADGGAGAKGCLGRGGGAGGAGAGSSNQLLAHSATSGISASAISSPGNSLTGLPAAAAAAAGGGAAGAAGATNTILATALSNARAAGAGGLVLVAGDSAGVLHFLDCGPLAE
jgi:hypothetical protein